MAFGFGTGLSPKAPGTMGTLAAVPLVLAMAQLSSFGYALVTLICILVGIVFCNSASKALNIHDHPGIVWDEIAGFMLTMIYIPITWQTLLVGFVLFRLFDIFKPWPIRYFDRHVHGGLGIMLDDLVAAIFSNLILRILLPYF
jgi:phosphatidylglycerophosphatase A